MTEPFQIGMGAALSKGSYQLSLEMEPNILDLLQQDMLNAMREEYRLRADNDK